MCSTIVNYSKYIDLISANTILSLTSLLFFYEDLAIGAIMNDQCPNVNRLLEKVFLFCLSIAALKNLHHDCICYRLPCKMNRGEFSGRRRL